MTFSLYLRNCFSVRGKVLEIFENRCWKYSYSKERDVECLFVGVVWKFFKKFKSVIKRSNIDLPFNRNFLGNIIQIH